MTNPRNLVDVWRAVHDKQASDTVGNLDIAPTQHTDLSVNIKDQARATKGNYERGTDGMDKNMPTNKQDPGTHDTTAGCQGPRNLADTTGRIPNQTGGRKGQIPT